MREIRGLNSRGVVFWICSAGVSDFVRLSWGFKKIGLEKVEILTCPRFKPITIPLRSFAMVEGC